MQIFQIEVEDNIADKVLWFLENLKENITIKKLDTNSYQSDLANSIKDLKNEEKTRNDTEYLLSNKKNAKKLMKSIENIEKHEDGFVYRFKDDIVIIASCRFHYEK